MPVTQESNQAPQSAREVDARERWLNSSPLRGRHGVTAVMTSFNKCDFVRKNLDALRGQSVKFDAIVVVDNASSDGTIEMITSGYPEVTLIVMPHSRYGACETFNIGFASARTDLIAILDDDVELPAEWVEKMVARLDADPASTAMISSHVWEPGTPDWYMTHPDVVRERYMATFRGCATLARRDVLERCGWYDADFFIYGNERDLSARVLNLGCRILQYPSVIVKHGTPFGMKHGKRSLYYHVRNLWWYLFKHVPWSQVARFLAMFVWRSVASKKTAAVSDAVGTIGFFSTVKETPGGFWVVLKATFDAFAGLPRCLRKRAPCTAADFSLPIG